MTARSKMLRNIGLGLAALVVILAFVGIQVVQSQWFRDFVTRKIITATEDGTGGKVEIGSFNFDWTKLEVVITDFVIHGNEARDASPFVRAARVQLNLRLFTSFSHILDVSYLAVDHPSVNILVMADGRTNVPVPRVQRTSSKTTALETIVDLAIGRFALGNGVLTFNSKSQPLDLRANNLRAQLFYNVLKQGYQGQLDLQPLYVIAGRQTPVTFSITLPVTLERDRIGFTNAKIITHDSDLTITGSLENLRDPKTTARMNGHVALVDLQRLSDGNVVFNARGVPQKIDVEGNATIASKTIKVDGLKIGIGQSTLIASGTLKDPQGRGALDFKSHLILDELGRLADIAQRPAGTVEINGSAKLDLSNNYRVSAGIDARNLAFQQGQQRIQGVSLSAQLDLDPQKLDLSRVRLQGFGGEFAGVASLEKFQYARAKGTLQSFDLRTTARIFGLKNFAYSGIASGPLEASADIKGQGTQSVRASANIAIVPGRQGIPLSGRLIATYNGAADDISVGDSYIAFPHSRLNLSGSLKNQLHVDLSSRDLNDLFAAVSSSAPHVKLNGGEASLKGVVTGSLSAPHVAGHVAMTRFTIEDRQFDSFAADVDAQKTRASVQNGTLFRGPMQTRFSAAAGLVNWSTQPDQSLSAAVNVLNGDLADMLVLAGRPSAGYSGALSAEVNVRGTIGNPQGTINLEVNNGTIEKEPFDHVQAQVNLTDQLVTIPAATIVAGGSQVNLAAEYQHPADSFTTGHLHAHVKSNSIDLAQLRTLQQQRPNTAGILELEVDATGALSSAGGSPAGATITNTSSNTQFELTSVSGDVAARGLRFDGETYGDVNAKATTSGDTVTYNLTSNFAGSNLRANGNTQLVKDYPTTADAEVTNLPIERILKLAKRTDIQAKGNLSGNVHFTGTAANPEGNADVQLANAVIYDEPLDRVRARVNYLPQSIDVSTLEVAAGRNRIALTANYAHPIGNLKVGDLQFRIDNSTIDLGRLRMLQTRRPGLNGTLEMSADGSAKVTASSSANTTPQILLHSLNLDLKAMGLAAQGQSLGDLTMKATTSGDRVNFVLNSNLANAAITGRGDAQLTSEYPVNARLTFNNLTWAKLKPLMGTAAGQSSAFDAVTDGEVTLNGPVANVDQLRASLRLSKLQLRTLPAAGAGDKPLALQNDGDIVATLDHNSVQIGSAHMKGPQTDITATGTASLAQPQVLNLNVNANANLGILQDMSRDIFSSGNAVVSAAIRGTISKPLVNGRLELHNASVNYAELPNGLSNANGLILFNGNTATIQTLNAESGGGKVTVTGFATLDDTLRLGLRANASNVRIRAQQGVSLVVSTNVRLTGTSQSSLASGTVTIDRITYAPQSDFGAILTSAAPPVQAPVAPNALLENMKMDIRVITSPTTAVQASIAQNLQLDADLRIRGTAARVGMLGRINITNGELVFFGATYQVNSGTIAFYNPTRIEPVLNIALETQAKGVNVVLNVSGPIDNMKLSYTSDPPLQFQEIATLLASGRTPTSDPTLLANQPSQPQQSFQQMGESAIVGKALADPVSSRLQRVFGVSQLKIDPSFVSGSDLPQANVTLQQQVSTNVVFTYVTALNDPNTQIIRAEWSLSPQWSAVADRDQNGIVSLNFLYKKQFR